MNSGSSVVKFPARWHRDPTATYRGSANQCCSVTPSDSFQICFSLQSCLAHFFGGCARNLAKMKIFRYMCTKTNWSGCSAGLACQKLGCCSWVNSGESRVLKLCSKLVRICICSSLKLGTSLSSLVYRVPTALCTPLHLFTQPLYELRLVQPGTFFSSGGHSCTWAVLRYVGTFRRRQNK